jgi:uncharacterized membrane protein
MPPPRIVRHVHGQTRLQAVNNEREGETAVFMRRGKSTEGWALIGFGVFACVFAAFGLFGGFGFVPDSGRAGSLVYLGVPIGFTAIILGIVGLYRDGRRDRD